jgi:hypothetical protein
MPNITPGMKVGRWTVLEELPHDSHHRRRFKCQCECGRIQTVRKDGLDRQDVVPFQIGCWSCAKRTHDLTHTPEYVTWSSMKSRCSNPNDDHWERYGKAGIKVCERWQESFEAFLEDMGTRPKGTTLDRYPNREGNYEPGNCRWATPYQQTNNMKNNVRLTIDGVTRTLSEWSAAVGTRKWTIYRRFRLGWSDRDCVFGR